MTIQNKTAKAVYIADGYSNILVIPFAFFENQVSVYKDNNELPLKEGIDYTITGNKEKAEGCINLTNTPKQGTVFTITRNVPLNQLVTFIEGENFPASDYENSLDKITMALQMLKENIDRCITITHNSKYTKEEIYDFLIKTNEEFETIKKVPMLAQNVIRIYEELLNFTTDTVAPNDNRMVSSKGVANHLFASYYTKDQIDEIKTLKYGPISISTNNIESDATYSNYPYHLDIQIEKATSSHMPTVVLKLEDAISGIYAPITESFDGYVRMFLKKIPSSNTIEIPIILLQ